MDRDLLRRLWVTASAAACLYGTLLGFGILGTPVEDSSSGALAADATLLAPAGPAFSIWSLIYLGLGAYTVWQWLPDQRTDERARATGWLAGTSMLLNAAWILVTQAGLIWASVAVILALVIVLGILVQRLAALGDGTRTEQPVVGGTFGASLGWVTVATCANIAAAGAASGWTLGPVADQFLAAAVLAVAACMGVVYAHRLGGRLAVALALGWGLSWIAVARLTDVPHSPIVGAAALAAAIVVLASTLLARRTAPALATA